MKAKLTVALLAVCMAFSLAACSDGDAGTNADSGGGSSAVAEKKDPAKDEVKVEDIAWTVDNIVVDGERRIAVQYENNSAYTIAGLRVDFVVKEGLSEEELQAAFSGMQSEFNEDPAGDAKKNGMRGEVSVPTLPGESSAPGRLGVGGYYINDMAQFEAVEPDLMQIVFLTDDGRLYTETYDFKNDSYSLNSNVIDTTVWGSEEPATMSPKAEGMIVIDVDDSAESFSFNAIGVGQEEFDAYVDACKEKGFTIDSAKTSLGYDADHVDGGFHIDCSYYSSQQELLVRLERL